MGFPPPDLLPAKNGEEQTVQFLLEVVDILLNYVRKTFDRSTKVLDFHHPHQLLEGMEGFNLELSDHPESLEQILVDCRDTLKYGVRTGKGESQVDTQWQSWPASDLCQLPGCQSHVEGETQTGVKEGSKALHDLRTTRRSDKIQSLFIVVKIDLKDTDTWCCVKFCIKSFNSWFEAIHNLKRAE